LEHGHPFEIGDPILTHGEVADYGWPHCYENRRKVKEQDDCSKVVVPALVFPSYNAPIGAAIYPKNQSGRYAFPAKYRGGLFVGLHGSWHTPLVPPRVAFVPLKGDTPKTPVNWDDPTTQWQEFLGAFQDANSVRIGRPTGIAVGPEGSLFVADDMAGAVYRIRPTN
jgi:glucose/arabinose dehydrogenase